VIALELEGEVDPMAFLVFPSADGSIELSPHDATLEGPSLRVERVGVIGDVRHNLGYWLDPSATASWPIGIGVDQGGEFEVSIEIACKDESAGAEMELVFEPGGALAFTVPATGGWQEYRTLDLGRVTLPWGSHRAILRAASKPGEAVANVRGITLRRP
jgi:hypothetical protein